VSESRKAWLALENGWVLEGLSVGAPGEAGGDLVFNTAMSGYHEILTDPSYAGQVVIMTYPLIGNYGVAEEDAESHRAWAEAFVIREMSRIPSNFRSSCSLSDWLERQNVVAIEGVDTRRLTRLVRTSGSLRCLVSTQDGDPESLVRKAKRTSSTTRPTRSGCRKRTAGGGSAASRTTSARSATSCGASCTAGST